MDTWGSMARYTMLAILVASSAFAVACGDGGDDDRIIPLPPRDSTPVGDRNTGMNNNGMDSNSSGGGGNAMVSTSTECAVFDQTSQNLFEWTCQPGSVCVLNVYDATNAPSEALCIYSPGCVGGNLSCGCMLEAGTNPCPGGLRTCKGLLGQSITCYDREE